MTEIRLPPKICVLCKMCKMQRISSESDWREKKGRQVDLVREIRKGRDEKSLLNGSFS